MNRPEVLLMKKLLFVLMLIFVVAGCSNSDDNKETSNNKDDTDQEVSTEGKVYDSSETAEITDLDSGSTYEVTFNSAEVKEKYNGKTIQEFTGIEELKSNKFVVINATFKNTSEETINLKEQIDPLFGKTGLEFGVVDNFEAEINKNMEPGESITTDLLYRWQDFEENTKYYLTFENFKENQTHITVPYPG